MFCICVIGAGIVAFHPFPGPVSRAIGHQLLSRHGERLAVTNVTAFGWTDMYVFRPGEDGDAVFFEQAGELGAGELASLIGVADLRASVYRQRLG